MLSASAVFDSTPIWANFGKKTFKVTWIAKKRLAKNVSITLCFVYRLVLKVII